MPTNIADAAEAILLGIRELSDSGHELDVDACGIGLPEYVHDGRIASSMVVHMGAAGRAQIAQELGRSGAVFSTRYESDVRCGALAEWHAAADPDLSLLYLSVGTGISSALVLAGGEVLRGAHGGAISLGEWPAPASSLDGHAMGRNLEQFASGQGISERYRQATGRTLSTRQIAGCAADDATAATILREAGAALGEAARRLYAVLDPTLIVVGGGLGTADTPLWRELRSAALIPIPGRSPARIRQARLGPHAGELGAALVALSPR
jgi:glucokinase